MEYLVFVIYILVVGQFVCCKHVENKGYNEYVPKGRAFYALSGIINISVSSLGINIINFFLKDKDVIPECLVWIALVGFLLMCFYGIYCIVKIIMSLEL